MTDSRQTTDSLLGRDSGTMVGSLNFFLNFPRSIHAEVDSLRVRIVHQERGPLSFPRNSKTLRSYINHLNFGQHKR